MNFLYPAFLAGALAIAIPIVLHFLRKDVAPEVPFTAVRLLQKSPIERSRRRRLRDILLLAARVAALLLLALAFARPYLPRAEAAAATGLRIVAIDRSFSMGAPGRFERARDLARAAIDEAGFAERVAVIAFDDRADVIALPGGAADARAALSRVSAGAGATRYPSVLAKAAELAAGGPARLVLVSDLQRAGWDGESRVHVPPSLTVDLRDAGAASANLAVADLRLGNAALVASVRNASGSARSGVVILSRDGNAVTRQPFTVAADASVDVTFDWRAASTAAVSASIEDGEGFAADNTRHAILSRPPAPTIMVVTSPDANGFYVLRALEAAGGVLEARPVTAQEIAGGRAQSIGRNAAVLLLSTRGLDRPARDAIAAFVRGGGGLLVAAAPDVEADVVAGMFGWPANTFSVDPTPRQVTLTVTDVRHPVFRPFGALTANLGQVPFRQSWRTRADGAWQVPATFSDGSPAVLERGEGSGRVVVVTSDLDRRWNDFPLHPSFVPFVVEAVRHVSSRQAQPQEFIAGRAPAGVSGEPGIHKTSDGRTVAVNVDPRESSTAVMTAPEFLQMIDASDAAPGSASQQATAQQTESRQNLWQYGLVLMLLTLVTESFIGKVQ
jgi:hypothetical protein